MRRCRDRGGSLGGVLVLAMFATAGLAIAGCAGSRTHGTSASGTVITSASTPAKAGHAPSSAQLTAGASPGSASELKRRLLAAGIHATDTPTNQQGAVGGVNVPVPDGTMVVIFFHTPPQAEAYAEPLTAGAAAGHGLLKVVRNHVYLLGANYLPRKNS